MTIRAPAPSRAAAFFVGVLAISPFAVALDLVLQFIPDFPAIQTMRAAAPLAKACWIGLAPLSIATIVVLLRHPLRGFVISVVFAALYFFAGQALWQHLTGGFWIAAFACLLAAVGAWLARSNYSSKPTP